MNINIALIGMIVLILLETGCSQTHSFMSEKIEACGLSDSLMIDEKQLFKKIDSLIEFSRCDTSVIFGMNLFKKNEKKSDWIAIKLYARRPKQRVLDRLEMLKKSDQLYRKKIIDSIGPSKGWASEEVRQLWIKQAEIDSLNWLTFNSKIIDHYGWPKISEYGYEASATAFLIVQHTNAKNQEQKLPLLMKLADEGEFSMSEIALLIDRIKVSKGEFQVYGSQVEFDAISKKFRFLPIEDEKNVDVRRTKVGLPPIQEYAKRWNIDYSYIK
ncbi:MAG TPA: hypothetical protein PLG25_04040 [bacterium]|nr:hypothetical protein [bacterium]HMZ03342.1 hypothetical protein [bacterium]HNB08655.1 hypothetical protein [bacterium]HND77647.1 hypothetical protein [bacterium]HNE83016.1 hypothetical protein [bacterium]